ncbi:MAG: gliding motility-associated C-terminal domain-containing protein [Bacteroidia bacterium]|nr:gliding motility-associated C-terminal domain-containing protein [Bacteroidia bacterium]
MIKLFNLFFIIIIQISLCHGIDKSPEIKRVCLDYKTSSVTIYWEKIYDNCNSFQKIILYSSENEGSWTKLTEIININLTEITIPINNLTSIWKFKITAYTSCNNIDSFTSNSVYIDKTPPFNIEIDSVSFDKKSQNIIIGWKNNSSNDIKGYKIYKYNNSVHDFISYSYNPYVILNTYSYINPEYFSIASFDSCNLYSLISKTHKAVYINNTYDTCKKSIKLSWNNYEGWNNIKSFLIITKNYKSTEELINVTGINSFTFKHLSNDSLINIYIKTINLDNGFTSSSNTIFIKSRKEITPNYTYLSNVTVENNSFLNISLEIDSISTVDTIVLYKSSDNSNFLFINKWISSKNKTLYEYKDYDVRVNNLSYQYIARTFNFCKDTISVSNIGTSILLNKIFIKENEYLFKWNRYIGWEKGVYKQFFQNSLNLFTWNTVFETNNDFMDFNFNNTIEETDSICFKIINQENINSLNLESISQSNIICIKKPNKYYFPQTINPLSNNNIFKIYGNNENLLKSQLDIYNRWGQKIFSSDNIINGWDFKVNEIPVDIGTYFYVVKILDNNNIQKTFKGTVLVIN